MDMPPWPEKNVKNCGGGVDIPDHTNSTDCGAALPAPGAGCLLRVAGVRVLR